MKKKKFNDMTQEELEEYVQNLPDEIPPKWSSAGLLGGLGVFSILAFALFHTSLYWLITGIAELLGAGYLTYKIITFGRK